MIYTVEGSKSFLCVKIYRYGKADDSEKIKNSAILVPTRAEFCAERNCPKSRCTWVTRTRFLNFWRNGALKLYVRKGQCFRILVRVTHAVDVSNDLPGKRKRTMDGLLLLQDDEESDCHPSEG